jgi:hypothetical protein
MLSSMEDTSDTSLSVGVCMSVDMTVLPCYSVSVNFTSDNPHTFSHFTNQFVKL